MSNRADDMAGSSSTHSANGEDLFTNGQGQEDYDGEVNPEVNPEDFYVRGTGYASVPGAESNPHKALIRILTSILLRNRLR